jgi:hypothetical protein
MKKNRTIKKKILTGLVASSLLLGACACNKKEEKNNEPIVIIQTVVVTATPTPTPIATNTPVPTNTPIPTNTPVPTNTPIPTNTPTPTPKDSTPPTEYHSSDDGLNAFWDDIYNKINYINWRIDNTDFNKVKEKTIEHAKKLIDFIFYGGTIDGKTFEELSDDAKQKVYEELQKVDSFIMQFIPDYKEKIGEKYNLVKDFASTTLEKAKEIFSGHVDIDVTIEKGKTKKLILTNKNE